MAKARASLASAGMANADEAWISIVGVERGRREEGTMYRAPTEEELRNAVSWAIRRGFCAPPPETMSWSILVFGRTKRCRASAIESAVKMVAVRMRSFGLAR